jgi:hypothetical protein
LLLDAGVLKKSDLSDHEKADKEFRESGRLVLNVLNRWLADRTRNLRVFRFLIGVSTEFPYIGGYDGEHEIQEINTLVNKENQFFISWLRPGWKMIIHPLFC